MTKFGAALSAYEIGDVSLAEVTAEVGGSNHLLVPRRGLAASGFYNGRITQVGDNHTLVGELGLPPNSGLILATDQLPEAVLAAVCSPEDEPHDPLAPRKDSSYGWTKYSDNDSPGAVPWASEALKCEFYPDSQRVGRLVIVSADGFRERPDLPGHFFAGVSELETHGSLLVTGDNLLRLVNDGLLAWRGVDSNSSQED